MNVRIRFPKGRKNRPREDRQLASALAVLLVPASLMAYALGAWRLGYDLGFANEFPIGGVFSHWQVWVGLALASHIASYSLNRYAKAGVFEVPRVLTPFPRPDEASRQQRKHS